MQAKRIISCLDVSNGRVVKGVNFVGFRDAGDPVEIAEFYNNSLADELVFLDISASSENRNTILDVVKKTVEKVTIPFTVGGGIRSVSDCEKILNAGASKVSINSAAIKRPELINEISEKFGSKSLVVAIDVKKDNDRYSVYLNGGQINSGLDAIEWALEVEQRGAGEILLTSMDCDGTKNGYDLDITREIADALSIPVIASGGAGSLEDFYDAFTKGGASGALAASLFHFKELEISEVKKYLEEKGVPINLQKGAL